MMAPASSGLSQALHKQKTFDYQKEAPPGEPPSLNQGTAVLGVMFSVGRNSTTMNTVNGLVTSSATYYWNTAYKHPAPVCRSIAGDGSHCFLVGSEWSALTPLTVTWSVPLHPDDGVVAD